MEFLYHGSIIQDLKTLEPRKRYTPSDKIDYEAIYATPIQGYAAAHSFPWSSDEGIDLDVIDGTVYMQIPKAINNRLLQPISIYKVPAADFEPMEEEETGQTWFSFKPCKILSEEKFSSVKDAFSKYRVNLKII